MDKITFIHTADLHLDSPFKGLKHLPEELFQKVRNSTFLSFERIVDKAIEISVDFVIISGDLYDEDDRSIRAQSRLKKQFERLQEEDIEVYVLHGNHDYLGNPSSHLKMPENVRVFGSDVEEIVHQTVSGKEVHLYGFSYDTRHVFQRKIAEYPKAARDGSFHIGILHGSEAGETSNHDPYAPFTLRELTEKNYHYWALGHIHVRQVLSDSPPIVYPGNIQGRHRKEKGPKGCYIVKMTEAETTMNFFGSHEILWEETSISLKDVTKFSQIFDLCKAEIDEHRNDRGVFLEIRFTDTEDTGKELQNKIHNGELLEAFQDGEEHQENFVWVHSLKIDQSNRLAYSEGQETFLDDLIQAVQSWDDQKWDNASSDLFLHPQAYRYIDSLNLDEKDEIKQSVLSMLEASFSVKNQ